MSRTTADWPRTILFSLQMRLFIYHRQNAPSPFSFCFLCISLFLSSKFQSLTHAPYYFSSCSSSCLLPSRKSLHSRLSQIEHHTHSCFPRSSNESSPLLTTTLCTIQLSSSAANGSPSTSAASSESSHGTIPQRPTIPGVSATLSHVSQR